METKKVPGWRRGLSAVGLCAFYLLLAVMAKFWRLWVGDPSHRLFLNGDVYHEYWPDLHVAWEAIRRWEWPLYNPFMNFGFPILSDPQHGLYYPPSWFYFAGAALFSEETAFLVFQWVTLLPVGIFGLGMHLYLRSLGLSSRAAWLGGIVAMSTGFVNRSYYLKFMQAVAWLPWVFLALELLWRGPNLRRAVFLGGGVGMTVIAGGPPGVFYTVILAGAYGVFRLIQMLRDPRGRLLIGSFLGFVGISGALSLAMSLIVILPVLEILPTTVRVGVGYSFMADTPANFSAILGFLVPGHKSDTFHGILPWLLCLPALALAKGRRPLLLFFAITGALGILLSFGPFSFAIDLLYLYLPGAATFRRSIRYIYLLSMALPVIAAFGFHLLTTSRSFRLPRLLWSLTAWVGAALLLILGLVLFVPAHPLRGTGLQPYLHLGFVLTIGVVLMHALAAAPRSKLFFAAFLGVLIFDLYALHPTHDTSPLTSFRRWSSPAMRQEARGPEAPYRVMNDIEDGSRNASNLFLVRDLMNYHHPLLSRRFYQLLPQIQRDPDILRFFNVKTYLSCLPGNDHGRWCLSMLRRFSPQRWRFERSIGTIAIYRALDPIPRVLWLPRLQIVASEDAFFSVSQKADPWQAALVEAADLPPVTPRAVFGVLGGSTPPPPQGATRPLTPDTRLLPTFQRKTLANRSQLSGLQPSSLPQTPTLPPTEGIERGREAKVIQAGFNGLTAEVEAPKEGVVLINEVFYNDWKATLDGQPLPLFRANYLMMGAFVPKGRHILRLEYAPRSFGIGLAFWLIGLVGGVGILVGFRRQELWGGVDGGSPFSKAPVSDVFPPNGGS